MDIRFLTPDDAVEWSSLRSEALQLSPTAFSSSVEEHQALPMDEVRRRLRNERDAFVAGAFERGNLVGMAGFLRETGPKTRHKGRVWGVYVTASKRGQGLGRSIMITLLARVAEIPGLEQVLLSVTSRQSAALSLYRSLRFEEFGREPRALQINGESIDEYSLILRLPRENS